MLRVTMEWNTIKKKLDDSSGLDGAESDPIAFAEALAG